jgi:DNA invertase Pin-like site-specific DNA recombinase
LLIAKLDRLTRSVAFVSALLDSKVKFVAVDFPEANELTIHILAAVAQNEAKIISQRTKAAFAAKKAPEAKKWERQKTLKMSIGSKATPQIKAKL